MDEDKKKLLWARMDAAGKDLSKGGQKGEGAYKQAYQVLVLNGLAQQLRKRYRGS